MAGVSKKLFNRRKFIKHTVYGAIATAVSPAVWLAGCSKRSPARPTNIFLITTDTLRADHLGCYGYHRDTSPNIDAFADDAMLFERCFSHASDTRFSFASLLSGFLPHETGILTSYSLPSAVVTLPQMLKRDGYTTAAVISNYVLRKKHGFNAGFDEYDDATRESVINKKSHEKTAITATNNAINMLEKYKDQKLFMWVHYQDPHGPYTPPDPYSKMFIDPNLEPRKVRQLTSMSGRGGIPTYQKLKGHDDYNYYVSQYDGEIRYHDNQFKRLIDQIKAMGMYDNSLIIFSSDHGEGMGGHNYYFAHGEHIYNGLIHVPLIVRSGNRLSGRRKDFVQHLDIVPTVVDSLGIESNPNFRGTDLRKVNNDKEIFAVMKAPFKKDKTRFSLIYKGFKLIYIPDFRQFELFDLTSDFEELTNLITNAAYLETANDLKHRLIRLAREDLLKINQPQKAPKLTPDEIKKLRSLGYVQ